MTGPAGPVLRQTKSSLIHLFKKTAEEKKSHGSHDPDFKKPEMRKKETGQRGNERCPECTINLKSVRPC